MEGRRRRSDATRSKRSPAGAADLLLATDAGAEGLNLQGRCRLVVNLELPWNPIRLEQRIGRVDRIGQTRTVHAINLFADGTAESTVLAGLLRRLERIQASEIEIAASIISSAPLRQEDADTRRRRPTETVDLKTAARSRGCADRAHARSRRARAITRERWCHSSRLLRSPALRSAVASIWFVRIRIANRAGRLVEDALIPVGHLGWIRLH